MEPHARQAVLTLAQACAIHQNLEGLRTLAAGLSNLVAVRNNHPCQAAHCGQGAAAHCSLGVVHAGQVADLVRRKVEASLDTLAAVGDEIEADGQSYNIIRVWPKTPGDDFIACRVQTSGGVRAMPAHVVNGADNVFNGLNQVVNG